MFRLNETFGFEDGFYFGTYDAHNSLQGLDLDLREKYYLAFTRQFRNKNGTAWDGNYGAHQNTDLPNYQWSYDLMYAKVDPISQSLQWVTNIDSDNRVRQVDLNGTLYWEYINNHDTGYDMGVSPYGGLVLVFARTYYVTNIFDNDKEN